MDNTLNKGKGILNSDAKESISCFLLVFFFVWSQGGEHNVCNIKLYGKDKCRFSKSLFSKESCDGDLLLKSMFVDANPVLKNHVQALCNHM